MDNLIPSLSLEDLAAFRIMNDKAFPLYKKLRYLQYDRLLLNLLFRDHSANIFITTKLSCYIAIKNRHCYLDDIPTRFITKELCEFCIMNDDEIMGYIPTRFITKELCELAIEHSQYCILFINTIMPNFITEEHCKKAVKRNGDEINHIPEQYRTHEMWLLAIDSWPNVITDIPIEYITEEICKDVVTKNGYNIEHIIKRAINFVTEELCYIAIFGYDCNGRSCCNGENYYSVLKFIYRGVPYLLTLEMCRYAVKQNHINICYTPEEFKYICYFDMSF